MQHNRKIIYLAGFLFSLPVSLSSYVNSSFISLFIGEKFIGLVYIFGAIGSILSLLLAPKMFKKIGGYKFLLLIIALNALSFLVLTFTEKTVAMLAMFILGFSMNTLIVFSLDEILKIFSSDSVTGKIRGTYLAISNIAWIGAQLASGTILGGFSFRMIYFVGFLVMVLLFILSFLKLKNIPDPKYDNIKGFKYIRKFFKDKNLSRIHIMSFLLQFFYSWMVIYTPIYLHKYIGFSWPEIGIIFSIMLLPFSLIPFHLGKYADKIGERLILISAFTLTAVTTILIFFIHEQILWLWALVLFISRVGASSIEVTSDTYFFKHIKPENEEFIGIYRNASPIAYIVGPIFAVIAFLFIPAFNFIYVLLGMIMLSGVYLASKIKKSDT